MRTLLSSIAIVLGFSIASVESFASDQLVATTGTDSPDCSVAGAGPAVAGPAEECRAKQLKAAGKACSAILKCYAKGATVAAAVDPSCTAAATAKLTSAFAKVEGKLACAVNERLPMPASR